jgi:hypothetical protein
LSTAASNSKTLNKSAAFYENNLNNIYTIKIYTITGGIKGKILNKLSGTRPFDRIKVVDPDMKPHLDRDQHLREA